MSEIIKEKRQTQCIAVGQPGCNEHQSPDKPPAMLPSECCQASDPIQRLCGCHCHSSSLNFIMRYVIPLGENRTNQRSIAGGLHLIEWELPNTHRTIGRLL